MTSSMLSTLHGLAYLIMTTSLRGSYCYYVYFTSEEIEAQKGYELVQSYTAKCM